MITFILLICYFYFIYYRSDYDLGTIGLLSSLNPSTLLLNDLGVVCYSRDSVKCVSEFVSKCKTLSRFRFGVDDVVGEIRDEDLMEMWKTIIGCKHIREVVLYHGVDVERQCRIIEQILRGLSQTQRDGLDWRRVGRVNEWDSTDITDMDVFNELVPSLNRK